MCEDIRILQRGKVRKSVRIINKNLYEICANPCRAKAFLQHERFQLTFVSHAYSSGYRFSTNFQFRLPKLIL